MKYAIGVDVGGTTFKIGVFTEDGQMISSKSVKSVKGNNGQSLFDDIAAAVKDTVASLSQKGIADLSENLSGIGIGIPGPIEKNTYARVIPNLAMKNADIRNEMRKRLPGINIVVLNDANAAALGEKWTGAGKGYESIIMITLGTGVGGGLVYQDTVISGYHGAGGEIGHIKVTERETEQCGCGGYGCLEQYASATGIVRVAEKMMKQAEEENVSEWKDSGLFKAEKVSARVICELAREGDALANAVLDKSMFILGKGLSYIATTFDPEVYVLGGGVADSYDILIPRIEESLKKNTTIIHDSEYKIVHAGLGNEAGMYGCAKYALIMF